MLDNFEEQFERWYKLIEFAKNGLLPTRQRSETFGKNSIIV